MQGVGLGFVFRAAVAKSTCSLLSQLTSAFPLHCTIEVQDIDNSQVKNRGEGRKKNPTKVSLQVLNFTLSQSNHFAKYKHVFNHIQTAKYSSIFTFHYSA